MNAGGFEITAEFQKVMDSSGLCPLFKEDSLKAFFPRPAERGNKSGGISRAQRLSGPESGLHKQKITRFQ